jgi:hypothetical protein
MTKRITGTREEWLAARLKAFRERMGRNETGIWWRPHDEYDRL